MVFLNHCWVLFELFGNKKPVHSSNCFLLSSSKKVSHTGLEQVLILICVDCHLIETAQLVVILMERQLMNYCGGNNSNVASGNNLNVFVHLKKFPENAETEAVTQICNMWLDYIPQKISPGTKGPWCQNNAIGVPNSAFPAVSWPYSKQSRPGNKAAVCVPRHSKPPAEF